MPQWLHDEWRNGDHLAMAKQYQACNFNKAPPLIFAKNLRVDKSLCSPKSVPAATHGAHSRMDCPERTRSSSTRRRGSPKATAKQMMKPWAGTQRMPWPRFSSGQRILFPNLNATKFQFDLTTLFPKVQQLYIKLCWGPRKKINGAVKCCEAGGEKLVRPFWGETKTLYA